MQPPRDSLSHQQLKLAEAMSNAQTVRAPPPAYSPRTEQIPAKEETFGRYRAEDEYDDDYEEAQLPAWNITVDAAIKIEGSENQVTLPPFINTPMLPSSDPRAIERANRTRAEAYGAVVRTAVTQAISEAGNGSPCPPINLQLNSGVHIKGVKNVVYPGSFRMGNKAVLNGPNGSKIILIPGDDIRKRRAQSVSHL